MKNHPIINNISIQGRQKKASNLFKSHKKGHMIFKVVSLSVRLFANMTAGHCLLKIFAGFAWSMLTAGGFMIIAHFLPLAILFPKYMPVAQRNKAVTTIISKYLPFMLL